MRHDIHNHFLPEPYVDLLLELDSPVGLEERDGELYMVHQRSGTSGVAGGNEIPVDDGFTQMEARLEWMDEYDVGATAVGVSTPNPLDEGFTTEQSTALIEAINDGYAAVQDEYPNRFVGLGMLPLRDPDAAVAEVDRIVDDLGLRGISLPTSIGGTKVSIPELAPVFERIDELDLPVFFHPHGNRLSDDLNEDESFLNPLVIFPTETTLQITRLIYDGFFDTYNFDVVLPHMGGTLLHLIGRIDRARDTTQEAGAAPQEPIPNYLSRFYYDVISFHRPALSAAIDSVGVEQFMFGTDYPFHEASVEATIADIESVVDDESDLERIMSTNAEELLDI